MEPLVSILIPAYNAREWLGQSIESALAQTWRKKEIIVVDDGSKDSTLEVAKRFASRNVQVITQRNQGAAVARNTAYKVCQGDYVQWLDADDLLDPRKVELQVEEIRKGASSRTLISGAWAYFSYRKEKARFSPSPLWTDLPPVEWLVQKMTYGYHMQTDNWLVSRDLSEAAGPWDVRLFRDNDGEYFARVIRASDGIRFVREAKSYYRAAGFKSISYIGGSNKKLESLLLSMKLHIEYLRSMEDSDRTRASCVSYIGVWSHEFYPFRPDIIAELKKMTAELGGTYKDPRLSWKYRWIVQLFGWKFGRRVQLLMPRLKNSAFIAWDRAMFQMKKSETEPQSEGV